MLTRIVAVLTVLWLVGNASLAVAADDENKLIGTWKLKSVTRGGMTAEVPETITILKHITPTHFAGISYDKDGKFIRSHGGTYSKQGEDYIETVEYTSNEGTADLIGKESKFTWKLDGNKWLHRGSTAAGTPINEVWVRVEKKQRKEESPP
ncbi:hypothetical protein NA78x_000150 [Anatilimnocola sp. NA78]|uniref:hypothetical protein n=1 Tax=Anatilimnocola sp. NA78 TaxID=3415683 RepID=UPI003CE5466C